MIVSQLQIYNFRRFKSIDGKPGFSITFHEGMNALIGEQGCGYDLTQGETGMEKGTIFSYSIFWMLQN